MTPNQASKKSDEKEVYSNLQDKRKKQTLKLKLCQLARIDYYPRHIMKVYYYQQNYLLEKTIKL